MGFYPWSRSDLGPACARIAEASTSSPVPPEGPDSGRRVSPSAVSDPSRGARSGAHHPAPLLRGGFVCGPRASWAPAHATPLGGCYVSCHDSSPAYAWGPVSPLTGGVPHTLLAEPLRSPRKRRLDPPSPPHHVPLYTRPRWAMYLPPLCSLSRVQQPAGVPLAVSLTTPRTRRT